VLARPSLAVVASGVLVALTSMPAVPASPGYLSSPAIPPRNAVQNTELLDASNAGPTVLSVQADGRGVRVGDWDEGHARLTHVDLRGRVEPRDEGDTSEHATHTTATLAGSGAGDATARGMAPEARVWAHEWTLDLAEAEQDAPVLALANHPYTLELGWTRAPECDELPTWWGGAGAREDAGFGKYGALSREVDALVYRTRLPSFWPAGNQRLDRGVASGEPHYHAGSCAIVRRDTHLQEATLTYDTLGGQAAAKNAIVVAAARDAEGWMRGAQITPLDISAFGPTDDGRIKPDLALTGQGVRSASAEGDDAYAVFAGTSSAVSAAAGAGALLTEISRRERGADISADLMRALMVQATREASAHPGPDARLGYGLLDVDRAARLIEADAALTDGRHLLRGVVGDEPLTLRSASASAGDTPLRVTLAWIDPPAAPNRAGVDDPTPALVNDLDLTVQVGDSELRYPWGLDAADPFGPAARAGPNRRDNLERVDGPAPGAGDVVRVTVAASGELHRGRPQPFALVSSVPLEDVPHPVLLAPRTLELEVTEGSAPKPLELPIRSAGGGDLSWRARALTAGIEVQPDQGEGEATLLLSVDPATVDGRGEAVERFVIESDDPRGPHQVSVLVRAQSFDPTRPPPSCPAVDLGSRTGLSLLRASTAGQHDDGSGSCGGEGSGDLAFAFTPEQAGRYRFALFGSRYQAVLHVRQGDCDGAELACSPAPDVGPVDLDLEAGERVVAVVDGRQGSAGEFRLDVLALSESCEGRCGETGAAGRCACDPGCVAIGDCCADACEVCGECRCARDCGGRSCGDDGCGGSCGECGNGLACDGGRCMPDSCAGVECDACTACVDGACEPLPEGAACEDGDLCTVLDRCETGRCVGQRRDCDDGRACTEDRCDPGSGRCEQTPRSECAACDGGRDCPDAPSTDAGGVGDGGAGPADGLVASDAGGDAATGGMTGGKGDGGCGCRLAPRAPGSSRGWGVAALAAAVAAFRFRRRAASRRCARQA
jgi:hypothetical protein